MIVRVKRKNVLIRIPSNLAQKMDIALICCSALGTHISRNRFIIQAIENETDLIFQEMKRIQDEENAKAKIVINRRFNNES
ncbi:MAG: hypothetical protein EKK57_11100 [Proteobacteria bacterium]|nr:MAG: hypothetical protein EKK57_11100 [Pseudomonadota bacterium]